MTREIAEEMYRKEGNCGSISNTLSLKKGEAPYLFITEGYYQLMVDKGETRAKEQVEADWIKQHLSNGTFDAKILLY